MMDLPQATPALALVLAMMREDLPLRPRTCAERMARLDRILAPWEGNVVPIRRPDSADASDAAVVMLRRLCATCRNRGKCPGPLE